MADDFKSLQIDLDKGFKDFSKEAKLKREMFERSPLSDKMSFGEYLATIGTYGKKAGGKIVKLSGGKKVRGVGIAKKGVRKCKMR